VIVLTAQDRARLREAASLINDVMDAHSHNVALIGDLPLTVIANLCQAIQETRVAERMLEGQ
jgi:hypothetical protein